jgi:RimJ/RimL family protein N-acetyltransferase
VSGPGGRRFGPRAVELAGRFVRLEPLAPKHAPALARALDDPAIWRWMPEPQPGGWASAEAYFAGWIRRALDDPDAAPWATVDAGTGVVVGSTRLLNIRRAHRCAEIGATWLSTPAQRTAINTEAKLLQLGYLFDGLGAVRVELKADHMNERSHRAIQRLGAVREGTLRRHVVRADGSYRDTVYYSILADEWPAVRDRLAARLAG